MLAAEKLSDPSFVPDTFASGLSHVENLGDGMWRLTFFSQQESVYGGTEYVVVARIIGTTGAIYSGMKTLMRSTGFACCGAGRMKARH